MADQAPLILAVAILSFLLAISIAFTAFSWFPLGG